MASPTPLHLTPGISSQPAGNPVATSLQVGLQASTLSVTATNGFRPSIPPKNSRVPAGEIDKLSSSKTSSPLNGISITSGTSTPPSGTQSLLPPPLPHQPIKGISNAQARTARKSAPSSSTRGDGYSTSSSGGGGRKSISSSSSGKNRERKDRESLSISESPNESPIAVKTGFEGLSRKRSPQPQTPLPAPKAQPQQQTQPMQLETQPPLQTNSQKQQQQKEGMAPVVHPPPPPIFGGPPAQSAGIKRTASPTLMTSFMSSKPKRQKNPTPKAMALANEPLMNADGSAVKKRKPKGSLVEKDKPRKSKNKGMTGTGVFPLADCHETGNSTTNGVTAKPANTHLQRLPNPPPPYQVPPHLQKQSALQGQQEKKDTPITLAGATNCLGSGAGPLQDARILSTSGINPKSQNGGFPTSNSQTPQRQKCDDVISISSSPTDQGGETRHQGENDRRLRLCQTEQGKSQNAPITIDIGSDAEESSIGSISPEESDQGVGGNKAKMPDSLSYGLQGRFTVTDKLFTKCVSDSTTDDERKRVLDGIIEIVKKLCEEASLIYQAAQISGARICLQSEINTLALQAQIAAVLAHVRVLTDEGKTITFDEWKRSGRMVFKGRFTLLEGRKASLDTDMAGNETEKLQEPQLSKGTIVQESDDTSSTEGSTVSSLGAASKSSCSSASSCDSGPDLMTQEKAVESPAEEESMEGVVLNGVLEPEGAVSSPPKSSKSPPPGDPTTPSQTVTQVPQEKQGQLSLSNQIQAEADASVVSSASVSDVSGGQVPTVSGKRKRKTFTAPTAQEFLKESKSGQELRAQRVSSFNMRQQERNDPLLVRINGLNKEELSVIDEIDKITATARIKESEFGRRIADVRYGTGAKIDRSGDLNNEPGPLKDLSKSTINWEEYRKILRELRDFREDNLREELRLADRAMKIVEERKYFIERRKRVRQIECELETASSSRTSEERSVDTRGSATSTTAASSVAGSSDSDITIPLPVRTATQPGFPEISVGEELLRSLIPWAKQFQEVPAEDSPNISIEATADQVKPKKKPIRKKKHW